MILRPAAIALLLFLQALTAESWAVSPPLLLGDFEKKQSHTLRLEGTAQGTARLTSEQAHTGKRALRVAYEFNARHDGVAVDDAIGVPAGRIPEAPAALELYYRRDTDDALRLVLHFQEHDGELWRTDIPLPAPPPGEPTWQPLRIPLTWMQLVTWERRDGVLDLDRLSSISLAVFAGERGHHTGSVCFDTISIVDAVIPVTASVRGEYTLLNLENVFDSDVIAYRDHPTDGDFHTGEWEPRTIPAEYLPQEPTATLADIPFVMPPMAQGQRNTIRANSQVLAGFPVANYSAVYFLAAAKFGDQSGNVRLFYEDGTTGDVALRVSDLSMDPQYGETAALTLPYAYFRHIIDRARQPRLFLQSVRVEKEKRLVRIGLPLNDYLKVFAITLTSADVPAERGALAERSLEEIDPRYGMRDLAQLDFTQPTIAAGVFGGALVTRGGAHTLDVPTMNGYLAFSSEARILPKSMLTWQNFRKDGSAFPLGGLQSGRERIGSAEVRFLDSTCQQFVSTVRTGDGTANFDMYLSRAWPGVFHDFGLGECHWYDPPEGGELWITHAAGGSVTSQALRNGEELALPDEPWLLLWHRISEGDARAERTFASPMLLVPAHRPTRLVPAPGGPDGGRRLEFTFAEEHNQMAVMPLLGIKRIEAEETRRWASQGVPGDIIDACREWARRLQRFPTGITQDATIDEERETVLLNDTFQWIEMQSTWDVEPLRCSPVPPSLVLARENGYPVALPANLTRTSVRAFYGPFCVVPDDATTYTLPLDPGTQWMLALSDVEGHPLVPRIKSRMDEIVSRAVPSDLDGYPYITDVAGDLATVRLYAPLYLQLGHDKKREAYARGVVRNALKDGNLKVEKEPETGQFFLVDDRFWAKDAVYDKEWCIGFMLQGLWSEAYYLDDFDFVAANWNKIRGLYRYYQIFFDWATGSTWTMMTGVGANSDGSAIAFEGMLAFARMAREIGDEAAYHDALVRTARQRASLYASWFAPQWAARHDYALSAGLRIDPSKIETRFAPDHRWGEYFTCNATHRGDFFQATHALFVFNLAHLMFLHDTGIAESKVRPWTFDIMPGMHPDWCDGNARGPNGEYYGNGSTMTHLVARAILFGAPVEESHEYFLKATTDTEVLSHWYSPMGLAPMALSAMVTGIAPLVEVPVHHFTIDSNVYSVGKETLRVSLRAKRDGACRLRVLCREQAPARILVNGGEAAFVHDAASGYVELPLCAIKGRKCVIEVQFKTPDQAKAKGKHQ
ncbi:MAG: hypothetical protein PWP23_394 [Candidatus Sumerlaeota bacterium]|nr:hypothetical protein [Candidatus Sumerlaeota bacterium]